MMIYCVKLHRRKGYIEFQVEHKRNIPSRIFEYAGLLHKRFRLPIISSVVYLRSGRYKKIPESLDIILDGRLINRYSYKVVVTAQVDRL